MIAATVLWPTLLGIVFLVGGITAYRHDADGTAHAAFGLEAFGPAFVAAALAAFAGEHFTAAAGIATLVPKWMPGRLFIAYLVGVAHLAAALSFVMRRYVRWSSVALAIMFALFVALMDVPGAMRSPEALTGWSLAARQATFACGALALFITTTRAEHSETATALASFVRIWTACVLIFYGIEHLSHPEFTPGVPSPTPTAAWVPVPGILAYATGVLLIACGLMMFSRKHASAGAARAGLLMTVLTVALYVPPFFIADTPGKRVTAINFIFDTLLFAGTMLIISKTLSYDVGRAGAQFEHRLVEVDVA